MPEADPIYALYKKARNHLRKCNTGSLIKQAIDILYEVHTQGPESLRYYRPWEILLVLKWTLQEFNSFTHPRKVAQRDDFHYALNIAHEMGGQDIPDGEYAHVTLFLRKLAFQQFLLQRSPDGSAIARQNIIFASLPPEHRLQRNFLQLTGISIKQYTEIAFATYCITLGSPTPRSVNRQDFRPMESRLAPETIDLFLRHLSKTIPELNEWFSQPEIRDVHVAAQLILPSPLLEVPLLSFDGAFYFYYPALLLRSLEAVVYRTLRKGDPSRFGSEFGPVFESYVARCLDNAGIHYLDESQLSKALTGTGKCVDFLIWEGDVAVLIDAKAVEMSPRGRVTNTALDILSVLRGSAVKGVTQGVETRRRLEQAPLSAALPQQPKETFLIVVTFDDLYLGSNRDFEQIFGANLLSEPGEQALLPFENIFFLSIEELEDLLHRIHIGKTTLVQALRHAQKEDCDFRTKKLTFGQHLDTLCPQEGKLPLISEALNALFEDCLAYFPPEEVARHRSA